ncbi:helicase associated domain-containing protein [Streptomyces chartreusis]|uniref:helicase associated domain-containing protein n=1 Tax=Streptomyces chartreusis TaxID=1969 RepID=UPI0012A2F2CB|nr:hypothetical protein CP983_24860 [Streptomyces chartreusis]GGX16736.1 hypothetical protein GCM10010321_33910 [Streptomyces chartreusis]
MTDWARWPALKRYTEREGHARVTMGHKEGTFPLEEWIAEQRRVPGAVKRPQRTSSGCRSSA